MKNTDQHIRELFKDLAHHESEVNPALWNQIQSALPAAAGTTVTATWLASKVWWIAAGAAVAGGITVALLTAGVKEEKRTEGKTTAPVVQAPFVETAPGETTQQLDIPADNEGLVVGRDTFVNAPEATENEPVHTLPDEPHKEVVPAPESPEGTENQGDVSEKKPVEDLPPAEPEEVTAEFNAVQVNQNQLRFFFFPQFPEEAEYRWLINGLEISSDMTLSYTFPEEGVYEVKLLITKDSGDLDTRTMPVQAWLSSQLVLPTIFTPNADAKNEFFDPASSSRNVTIRYMAIFEPGGKKVFESDGTRLWDGNDAFGNPLPSGTYKAVVKATDRSGQPLAKTGNLVLTR